MAPFGRKTAKNLKSRTVKRNGENMPQNERLRVWKNELKKTSGGLTRAMLMKNKRGKIVSKKKSEAARKNKENNNLGNWLRSKGEKFLSKGLEAENIVRKGKAGRKAFKKEEEVPDEKQSEVKTKVVKKVQKKVEKKVVKKVVKKKVVKKKVVKKAPAAPPKITKTAPMQAGEQKSFGVSVGNIITQEMKDYREMVEIYANEEGYTKVTKVIPATISVTFEHRALPRTDVAVSPMSKRFSSTGGMVHIGGPYL